MKQQRVERPPGSVMAATGGSLVATPKSPVARPQKSRLAQTRISVTLRESGAGSVTVTRVTELPLRAGATVPPSSQPSAACRSRCQARDADVERPRRTGGTDVENTLWTARR